MWVVINGKVYDLTKFYLTHPGGPDVILENRAKDSSQIFNDAEHPLSALRDLENFVVGEYV